MSEIRKRFHDELQSLEADLVAMSEIVVAMLGDAVSSLVSYNKDLRKSVIARDDEVDALFLSIENRWHEVMAMQTPVAVDLRLMSAITHINGHLERMGDVAVNIAKTGKRVRRLPTRRGILDHIQEMVDVVRPMIRAAVDSFTSRDLDKALGLPGMDDEVDLLNRRMYTEVVDCAGNAEVMEWAIRMMVVSRHLERVGDHAVDIAEQAAFLITGEFREFSDQTDDDDDDATVGADV